MNTPVPYSKEERKLRKALGELIINVRLFEAQIDSLFAVHDMAPVERGKKVAELINKLCFKNDEALYFGLGFDYHKDGATKRKSGTNITPIRKWAAKTTRETK